MDSEHPRRPITDHAFKLLPDSGLCDRCTGLPVQHQTYEVDGQVLPHWQVERQQPWIFKPGY